MIISMSMFWPPPPRPFQLPASRGRRGDPAIADRGRGINQRASLGNGFTLVWLARLGRALLIRFPALLLRWQLFRPRSGGRAPGEALVVLLTSARACGLAAVTA